MSKGLGYFRSMYRLLFHALAMFTGIGGFAQDKSWTVKADTYMRTDTLAWKAKDVTKLTKGTKVELIRSHGAFAYVRHKNFEGYVWAEGLSASTPPEDGAEVIRRLEEQQRQVVEDYHKLEAERSGNTEERRYYLVNKYGEKTGMKLYEGYIWEGMSKPMATDSWGEPIRVNASGGASGEREQWVYGEGRYLYFQDGMLVSWQQ